MNLNNNIISEKYSNPKIPNELDENGYSIYFVKAIELKLRKDKFIEPPSQDIDDIMDWLEN